MYKIVGADQKEYGPVTEEQLRQWIIEGRANAQTLVQFNDGPWKPLSSFPEFSSALPGLPPLQPTTPPPLALPTSASGGPPANHGMAIAGLVCSILGLFCCGPLFSTLGLILSILALSQINQYPTRYSGKGVAIAGIVLALVGYVLFAFLLFTGVLRRAFRHFPRYI